MFDRFKKSVGYPFNISELTLIESEHYSIVCKRGSEKH